MSLDASLVLLLAGDVNEIYITQEQVNLLSSVYGENPFLVAAAAARSIAAVFAPSVTKKSGDVSINSSDKFDHYMALAKDLDRKAALFGLGATSIYAGGISQSDKDTRESNGDRTQPYFTRTTNDDNNDTFGTASTW